MHKDSARRSGWLLVTLMAVAVGLAFVIRMAQPGATSEGEPVAQVWPTSTPLAQLTDTNEPLALADASTPPSEEQEEYPPPVYPIPTWPSLTPVSYPLPTYVPQTLPPPSPTPTWPTPTDWPTFTPTPVVTSIPTAELPIIPEALEREEQPFWFIYWEGNQIWRVDDQGNDPELLLDVQEELGQFIEGHTGPGIEGFSGPRVVVSPDGRMLALNTPDKINVHSIREPIAWSVFILDTISGDVRYLGEGQRPYWSPDAQHFAYYAYRNGTALLYVVDVASGEVRELARGGETSSTYIMELSWSPDSQYIAYTGAADMMESTPRIWVLPVDGSALPEMVYEQDTGLHGIRWLQDGQSIRFVSPRNRHEADLCEVSLTTGQMVRLTHGLNVMGDIGTPYDGWTTITAGQSYEQDGTNYDAWLLRDSDAALFRVTAEPDPWGIWGWTPDGTRMLLRQTSDRWILWSPAYGTGSVIDFVGDKFAIGSPKSAE